MKANELRKMSLEDLTREQYAMNKEIFNMRIQRGLGQLKQTHLFKSAKKDIARINTILREKKG